MTNKQLKEQYKQKKFRMGVFQVRNHVNGKILLGSSVNLDAIWNRIRGELRFGGHRNEALQRDWTEYGDDNFSFEVLSEITEKEGEQKDYAREAIELEAMYIDELQPFGDKGYHPVSLQKQK